jgi:hypothetical protein
MTTNATTAAIARSARRSRGTMRAPGHERVVERAVHRDQQERHAERTGDVGDLDHRRNPRLGDRQVEGEDLRGAKLDHHHHQRRDDRHR